MKINSIRSKSGINDLYRLFFVLFILFFFQNQESFAQSVSLSGTRLTLKTAFTEIEKQTQMSVDYNREVIDVNKTVTLKAKQGALPDIMTALLQGTGCVYTIKENHIVISVAPNAPQNTGKEVSGTVTDEKGEPIIGANVVEKGTTNGVITDMSGNFSLSVSDKAILQVSYIGYIAQEAVTTNRNTISIILREDNKALNEVVVVGYGTQRKITVSGSIASTSGKEIGKVPSLNVTNTLAGRLPGLVSYNRSGEPGFDDAVLSIRGASTTGDASPLVVVDGVASRAGGFNRIDPNDIESVTILKDASAAIYGSRSANGVILITTKRGKEGKISVNYNGNVALSTPTVLPKMASSYEYATLLNEITPGYYSDDVLQKFKDGSDPLNYPNVDVFDEILKPALQTQHNISMSGGNNLMQFFASIGTSYQDNYYKNSASNYKQYNVRSNLDITPSDNFKIGLNLAFRQEDRNSPQYGSEDIWRFLIKYKPMVNIWWPGTKYGTVASQQDGFSPAVALDNSMGYQKRKQSYLNADLTLHWDLPWITEGLSVDGGLYIDRSDVFYKGFRHIYHLYNYDQTTNEYTPVTNGSNSLDENMNQTLAITMNARINYVRTFAEDHKVNVFAAYEQFNSKYDYLQGRRQDYISTSVDELFAGDSNTQTNNGTASEWARVNFFGRFDYTFKDKYLFQFNWRYDGSENFPSGNRFGFFPGVSAGWRISEEAFWKDKINWMDYLKVRASWGQMGNDNVSAFQYMTAYTFGYPAILNNKIQTGLWLRRTANPNITWEVADTYNIGLEAKFLNDFNFEGDVFYTKRSNILAVRNTAIPEYVGLSLPDENIGECSNRGIELLLGWSKNITADWRLNISGNFTYNKSRIDYIDEPEATLEWQKRTGRPIGSGYLMYEADGIFRTQEELDAYPHLAGVRVGDIRFRDVNNDGVINSSDKIRPDKTTTPNIMYGLNLGVNYKDFSLSMLLQGAADVWQYTYREAGNIGNYTKEYYDNRWTENNINAKYPRTYNGDATVTGAADYINTFWLNNASYIRLKNIELSYSLPQKVLSNTPFSQVRFLLSGYNLLTFTGLKDIDPEIAAGYDKIGFATPQSKVINFGVNLTF